MTNNPESTARVLLSLYLQSTAEIAAAILSLRFVNFSSIAVLIWGFAVVAPERCSAFTLYGLRVIATGMLSNLMTATVGEVSQSLN
jgi:nucleoside permease NupC